MSGCMDAGVLVLPVRRSSASLSCRLADASPCEVCGRLAGLVLSLEGDADRFDCAPSREGDGFGDMARGLSRISKSLERKLFVIDR